MATSGGVDSGQLYTRKATGLVREISVSSSLAISISFISIPLAVLVATQAPFAFPGSSPLVVTLIAAVLCLFPVLLYGLFVAIMPRSGGDYVFVSRSLHPWLGFAANFSLTMWVTISFAYVCYLTAVFGVSSALTTLGVAADVPTLTRWGADVTSKNWSFAIGALVLAFSFAMFSLGLRWALRIQKFLIIASLIGVVVSIVLLLINGRSDFEDAVGRFGGDYQNVISDALAAGYAGSATFDFGATVLALPLAFTAFGYAIVTAYAGGEMRTPRRTGVYGMALSLLVAAGLASIMMALANRTFGDNWMGAATYLSNTGDSQYPFASPAFLFFFVSMLTDSTFLITIISLSFIFAFLASAAPAILIVTRNLFAWSFDRILPTKLADVEPRTHSPLIGNVVVSLFTLGYLALIVYRGGVFLGVLYTGILAELFTFMIVAIAAVVFPFRRRALYDAAALPVRRYIGRIPVFSVIALVALGVYALFFYPLATRTELGANTRDGWIATIVIAAVGLLLYPISYVVNRMRGIDLGLAFKELPPE